MADTASLIARVKTEGVQQADKQLDDFAVSATNADNAVNKLTPDVNKLNTATGKASSDGLNKFKNAAGQVGFQVQDMVVQLQGGTSAFVAIGQQGSQLAGAFGPGGAVLGAVIALAAAVGGVLYKSLGDARATTEELSKAGKDVNAVLQQNTQGAYELSDAYVEATKQGESFLNMQAKISAAQAGIAVTVGDATRSVKEASDVYFAASGSIQGYTQSLSIGAAGAANAKRFIDDLSQSFGISGQEAQKLAPLMADVASKPTIENVRALQAETQRLVDVHGIDNKALLQLNSTNANYVEVVTKAAGQTEALTRAKNGNTYATNSNTQAQKANNDSIIAGLQARNKGEKAFTQFQAEQDKERFAKQQGATKEQIAAYNAARDEQEKQEIARITATENAKQARTEKTEVKQQATLERQAEAQKKAADNFIAGIQRQSGDEIAQINTTEQQKLDTLTQFQQQGAISAKQYEDTKTQIQLNAETARQEELDKKKKDQMAKDQKGDDFMAQILGQNAVELELFDIQQKQKEEVAKKNREQGIINEEEYQAALVAIASNYNKKRRDSYANMLGQTTDDLRSALGEGNKLYKAFAIANAIMNTYQAAVAAYQSAAAIPIVGWVLGPVAAGAAVAAGLANVAKIRSAREQGGNLSAGQISTIAERGKPEVIMPASASRVRTAQQMRQIMGDDSANKSSGDSVVIVNNTTGRIDSATTERDDEGRLMLTLDERVSSLLADSNSKTSKSRRGTRGQPGF